MVLVILGANTVTRLLGHSIANERAAGILLRQTRQSLPTDPIALYAVATTHAAEDHLMEAHVDDPSPHEDIDPCAPRHNERLLSELSDADAEAVLPQQPLGRQLDWQDIIDGERHARPVRVDTYRTWRLVVRRDRVEQMNRLQPASIIPAYIVRVQFAHTQKYEVWQVAFKSRESAEQCRSIFEEDPMVMKWVRMLLIGSNAPEYSCATIKTAAANAATNSVSPKFPSGFKEVLKRANMLQFGHWTCVRVLKGDEFFSLVTAKAKDFWFFNFTGAAPGT